MKLISLNIEKNLHNNLVLAFLKRENADVVCLQELLEEDVDLFKRELKLDSIYQSSVYLNDTALPGLIGKKQGVGIFAKNIIASDSIFYYGEKENILKPFSEYINSSQNNHALVWADIKNNDVTYKVITIHLPVTNKGETTPFQLEVINALLSRLDPLEEFVLCGDTNAPRGKEAFRLFTDRYKDNIPLEYKTSIDQNLHKVKGLQHMVDGLFTTSKYKALKVKLVDGVSDHMAIVAQINQD